MITTHAWREHFLTLIADTRRLLDLPADSDDPMFGEPLMVKFIIDGVGFELLHMVQGPASGPHFLLQGHFGPVSPDAPRDVIADVLAKNHELARLQLGNYGIDAESNELVFNLLQPMRSLEATQLAEALAGISAIARQWRADQRIEAQQTA